MGIRGSGSARHSEINRWGTPRWLFDALDERFHFTVDLCAEGDNTLCKRFGFDQIAPGDDAWINPPYGKELAGCLSRAVALVGEDYHLGQINSVVALVPVRTSVEWWQMLAPLASQIVFIRGRLQFGGVAINAPFDSCVMVFGGRTQRISRITALRGQESVEYV